VGREFIERYGSNPWELFRVSEVGRSPIASMHLQLCSLHVKQFAPVRLTVSGPASFVVDQIVALADGVISYLDEISRVPCTEVFDEWDSVGFPTVFTNAMTS